MQYTLTITIQDEGAGVAGQATSMHQQLSMHGFGPIDKAGMLLAKLDEMATEVVNKHIRGEDG